MIFSKVLHNAFKQSKTWNSVAFYNKQEHKNKQYLALECYESDDPFICIQTQYDFGYSTLGMCGSKEIPTIVEDIKTCKIFKKNISDRIRSEINIPCIGKGNELQSILNVRSIYPD